MICPYIMPDDTLRDWFLSWCMFTCRGGIHIPDAQRIHSTHGSEAVSPGRMAGNDPWSQAVL